jgi:3-deoxy-manno-octulosonate cytidylyltransferase (CMP-KDO synthetase)
MHKAVAIIPARFDATRFPGKPLALLRGKPIIQHVYEHATNASLIDFAVIATDDNRIFDAVNTFGGKAVMTSADHESGTDRIAEAAEEIECEYIVNVQGDEPFIRPEMIDDVVDLLYNDDKASISTLAKKITDIHDIRSPHVVKVVTDKMGYALYFSRSPIPFYRDEWQDSENNTLNDNRSAVFKHIGIYGFRKKELKRFTSMEKGRLEQIEKLEQLRALAAGMKIKVGETEFETHGIDTLDDLRRAEEWLSISL